jgi:hypothetical protein
LIPDKALWECNDVMSLKRLSGMPRERVDEVVAKFEGGSPELRQTEYYLYRTGIKVRVRVPGGNEFSARDLKVESRNGEVSTSSRQGMLLLKRMGAKQGEGAAISLSQSAQFEMIQDAQSEGLLLKLSSLDWEIQ